MVPSSQSQPVPPWPVFRSFRSVPLRYVFLPMPVSLRIKSFRASCTISITIKHTCGLHMKRFTFRLLRNAHTSSEKTKSQRCTIDFRLWPYLKKRMTFSMGPLGLYDSISDSKSVPSVERVESRRMVSNSSNPEARTVSIKSSAAARLPSFT